MRLRNRDGYSRLDIDVTFAGARRLRPGRSRSGLMGAVTLGGVGGASSDCRMTV